MSSSAFNIDKQDVSEIKIERFNYQWKIKNFRYSRVTLGEMLESPVFSFGSKSETKWFVRVYPNGKKQDEENYLKLVLCWNNVSLKGEFKLSLINDKNQKEVEREDFLENRDKSMDGHGFSRFIKRDFVLDKANGMLPNDCLTINCEIVLYMGYVKQSNEYKKSIPMINLGPISWSAELFLERHFSDIKVVASSGDSMPAHRSVLAACSPVFQAMFKNDMLEQRLGEVKINDAEGKTLKEMLRFIYLGKVENVESIALELFKLAHKYQISGLSELCETVLINQLAADNVLNIITVADLYNVESMKSSAIRFSKMNIEDVKKSEDFKSSTYHQAIKSILEAYD